MSRRGGKPPLALVARPNGPLAFNIKARTAGQPTYLGGVPQTTDPWNHEDQPTSVGFPKQPTHGTMRTTSLAATRIASYSSRHGEGNGPPPE